jgi:hypothetical protein
MNSHANWRPTDTVELDAECRAKDRSKAGIKCS